ncbi:MAG: hypothetical protein M9894_35860 [Planctomycetes bacterium]|nr:hypothetical protein [Planctomycetota bacterium]
MKRIVVAAGLLALAACERADETPPDLLAECRTLADRAARIDACTRVIDDAAIDGAARAAARAGRAAGGAGAQPSERSELGERNRRTPESLELSRTTPNRAPRSSQYG